MKVRFSLLPQQFAEPDAILAEIRQLVASGDFTLGKPVDEFEQMFAELTGNRHAIGVGSGTDAIKVPLKALGIGPGDEVITAANTFIATVGAINEVGGRSVLVDVDDTFCIDPDKIEAAITPRTKAIVPVHLTGGVADMARIMAIAEKHGLKVVEDGCQSLLAERHGKRVGSWGNATAYSMHPLKILNVWGDAGIVVTDDDALADTMRKLRNHGLKNRDEIEMLGYNTRLDSLQAIVGKSMVRQARDIVSGRAAAADYYDAALAGIPQIRIPPRGDGVSHVFLLYMVFAEDRDGLHRYLLEQGVEAKVHYPIPLYHQQGLAHLGYRPGDFPVTDAQAKSIITFPLDQYLSRAEQDAVVKAVRNFYGVC